MTGDCDNGEGLWEDVFGDLYSGRFREGRYHGFGRLENGTNYVFEGEFQAGEFHGRGILVDHGRVFSGRWKEGREANGSGSLTLPNGSQFEGEGDWINGFTGRGAFVDPKLQLRAEGEFERANGLGGIRGTGSIRSLVTGSVYRGRFERGEPVGPGEVEMAAGARLAVRFDSMTALIVGLGQTNPAALGGDRKTGELVIESVPEPVGSPPAERQAKPGRVNLTGAGERVPCNACGGSGFQLRSCGWCGGQGSVSRPVTTYKRKDTPFAARSVYDSAGRFVGNSSGYDVTYYHVITPHDEECRQCRGTGVRTTNIRCPVCRGGGSVEGR